MHHQLKSSLAACAQLHPADADGKILLSSINNHAETLNTMSESIPNLPQELKTTLSERQPSLMEFRRRRRSPSLGVLARSARENQKVARCARAIVGQEAVRALGGRVCIGGPGIPWLLCLCVGLLLVRVSCELNDISRARKLCGRHLLQEIVKLCGSVNWSHIEEEKPFTQLLSQASEKVETFIPDRLESSQTTFPVWRRATN
ncbi:hypothetical protein EI555_013372, partial [Monodon monoceros]